MGERLLFDKDNLKKVFAGAKGTSLLKKYGFSWLPALYTMLIERKTKDCEYIVGPAGVGKTTLALSDQYGAKIIETQQDIIDLLTLNFDELVCVTSILDETIAKNAKRITLLHANEERLRQHRALRDAQILEGTSQTAFGRNPGSTQGATIDDDILISRLKKDYEDKSRIISYTSDDVANFDEKKEISVKDGIGDEVKYLQQGITSSSGKFSPIHVVHEKLLRKGYEFAQEHALPFCILVVRNSWGEYDFALTPHEKRKLIKLSLSEVNATLLEDISEYIKVDGKIIKVDPKQSYVFLGKERLPEGFIEGSTEELLEKYPGFDETPEGYSVKKMKGAYFFNLGDIKREGSEESVSATYVRKNLIEGNVEALASVLSPQVFEVLTQPENLQAIKRRYQLVEKKKKNLADFKQRFDEQHRMHHPLTKEPLLKKDGTPKLLSKHLITTKTSPKDAERILQYIEKKKALYTKHKGLLEKKWRKTIYSSEHELQFPE